MNIWVIDFNLRVKGMAGYAQLPVANLPGLTGSKNDRLTDGVVINAIYFGKNPETQSLGRTLIHETGHFLGLIHIWGDAPAGQNACQYDDYCPDTPNTAGPTFDCSAALSSCEATQRQMPENFMDYSSDACMNFFTNDQTVRMRTVLENSPGRVSLLTSPGLSPLLPPDTILANSFKTFPNPSTGEFTLEVQAKEEQSIKMEIVNALGEVVSTAILRQVQPLAKYKTDLVHLPSGVYLVKLQGETFSAVKRIIKVQ